MAKYDRSDTQLHPENLRPLVTRYERVLAGDIRPGDRVARTRTRPFFEVAEVRHGDVSVWIIYSAGVGAGSTGGGSDRPAKTAKWWREVA